MTKLQNEKFLTKFLKIGLLNQIELIIWYANYLNESQLINLEKNTHTYSISQKWVHPSHFCKYFISFHVTTLKKWHFSTM